MSQCFAQLQLRRSNYRGFTLLEVMIAVAVTLLMMLGLAQMFKVLGDSINQGRTGLELNNRLRGVMHRVRTDLDNVTAPAHPPLAVGVAQGYLKYYEGPASDYTLAQIFPNQTPVPTNGELNPLLNRFGDVDDIFMATVKAKDTWFTGKVPSFIVERRAPTNTDVLPMPNGNGVPDDLESFVTISSQFAEVVIYAQPTVTSVGNPTRDPVRLVSSPTNYEVSSGGDVPNSYRLYYRTLLIRPDLNLNGILPVQVDTNGNPVASTENIMVARPQRNPDNPSTFLASPLCDMSSISQYCDLSIRRLDHSGVSFVAANSLEDLANPANRFAHVMLPLNAANTAWSVPVLALGGAINPSDPNYVFQGPNPSIAGSGFLHPAFVLHGDRTGEDLLTTDLLAFDVRAYDPSAPIINYGDVTLRPGDPGFGRLNLAGTVPNPGTPPNFSDRNIAAHGEFVDLNWAGKLVADPTQWPAALRQTMASELSGLQYSSSNNSLAVSDSLFNSGLALVGSSNSTPLIFQPSYDTYTNLFERDGILHAVLQNSRGVVTVTGSTALAEPWRASSIDAGTDGIDNNPTVFPGIDDTSELETSPPFPIHLRGLQISIRLEDGGKKQFKQMSTVKEFVTN